MHDRRSLRRVVATSQSVGHCTSRSCHTVSRKLRVSRLTTVTVRSTSKPSHLRQEQQYLLTELYYCLVHDHSNASSKRLVQNCHHIIESSRNIRCWNSTPLQALVDYITNACPRHLEFLWDEKVLASLDLGRCQLYGHSLYQPGGWQKLSCGQGLIA